MEDWIRNSVTLEFIKKELDSSQLQCGLAALGSGQPAGQPQGPHLPVHVSCACALSST